MIESSLSIPQLFTYEEAAEILKVSPVSLRRWVSTGKMGCLKIGSGSAVRFTLEQIRAVMREKPAKNGGAA